MAIKMKKPKGIVFKIFGVTTNRQFTQTLDQYFESHYTNFLKSHWDDDKIKKLVIKMKNESIENNKRNELVPKIEINSTYDTSIASIQSYVRYWLRNKDKETAVDDLMAFIWADGFKSGAIQAP